MPNRRLVPKDQSLSPDDLGEDVLEQHDCSFEFSKPMDYRNTQWIFVWRHNPTQKEVSLVEEPSLDIAFIEFPSSLDVIESAVSNQYEIYLASDLLEELETEPGDLPNQFELLALLVLASDERSTTDAIIQKIVHYLDHEEFDLRYLAYYALGYVRHPKFRDHVARCVNDEPDERIRSLGKRLVETDGIELWETPN